MRRELLAGASALALLLAMPRAAEAVDILSGINSLVDLKVGAKQVLAVYHGDEQVWTSNAPFEAGNQSHGSVLEFARYIAARSDSSNVAPTAGGTLSINSQSLGSYDYTIKVGNQTVSSFTSNDWFTTTADSRSAFVIVKGNLTINAGQVFKPSARKLFVCIYVTGNLVVNGEISMSQRGANHSATGSNITAAAIRIATGTFSTVVNPQVPAAGATGGAARSSSGSSTSLTGNVGSTGTDGATGGGGSGALRRPGSSSGTAASGAGATGSSFSGGPAGGACQSGQATTAQSGSANGAKGGNGASGTGNVAGAGGAGNPGGTHSQGGTATSTDGADGTGGVLVAICEGSFSGSGSVTAAGANGGTAVSTGNGPAGGGSGGGSVTIMAGSDSGPAPTALGGSGGATEVGGGNGGNGTARKLAL